VAAAKTARFDPKDVWNRPKDAVAGKIFSEFLDTLSLSTD
jgi:hypothetical protein